MNTIQPRTIGIFRLMGSVVRCGISPAVAKRRCSHSLVGTTMAQPATVGSHAQIAGRRSVARQLAASIPGSVDWLLSASHWVWTEDTEIVRELVEAGANINIRSGILDMTPLGWARRGTLTEVEEVLLELGRSLAGLSNGPLSRFSHLCGYGREKSDVGPGERSRSRRVFLTVKLRWHLDRSPPFDHTIVECTPLAEPPRMAIRAPFANLDTGPLEVFCFVRNARRAR